MHCELLKFPRCHGEPTVCYVVLTRDVMCRLTRNRSRLRTWLSKITLSFSSVVELTTLAVPAVESCKGVVQLVQESCAGDGSL